MKTLSTQKFGLTLALVSALAACGGGVPDTDGIARATPLLDDDGNLQPTVAAAPADTRARIRSGRYATPEQAADLARAFDNRVLDIDLDCCGNVGPDLAVNIAFGIQAAADLANDTPVLVRGQDAREVAAVAERLARTGYDRVFVVTQ